MVLAGLQFAFADDFKTIDGKEYKNVTVSKEEPDGITVTNKKAGVMVKLYFTELPKEVQEKFNYDPEKAAAYEAEQTASQREFQKQQEESQRKLTEEKSKHGAEAESLGHKRWISGKIVSKSNDALLIECSGEGADGYEGATGRIVLRDHPNFATLAEGDRVAVFAVAIAAVQWGGANHPYLHAYRRVP